jgi:ABC-type Mn2+/Zn2+ transport system permease subunit
MKKLLRILLSFLIGCIIGIVGHYTLYRIGLPVEPFIYMAF